MAEEKLGMTTFSYVSPEESPSGKAIARLVRGDRVVGSVQVLRDGGENNLHSHSGSDGFWFVLEGSVNWYGDGDEFIAKLDKHDGILVPRGTPYWFEQTGDVPLELLHVVAKDPSIRDERNNIQERVKELAPELPTG